MLKLSIIVPVFNVELYLVKCLESIINQTFTDFELILVNDGSTDASQTICLDYLKKDHRIILYNKENGGLSSARNFGLSKAKGKYIAFIDSDDWIDLHMYETMVKALEDENADIVVCGHYVVNFNGSIEEIIPIKKSILYDGAEATKLILKDEQIFSFAWDKIYKKELFDDIRYPDGRIYEDTATTYKLFHKAKSVFHLNKAFYFYVRRMGSLCFDENKALIRSQHNFLSFYERYLFIKEHDEYSTVLNSCESFVFNMGLNILHYNIKSPHLFEKTYFHQILVILRKINVIRNPSVTLRKKIEYKLFSFSEIVYRLFLRTYYNVYKK